VLERSTWLIWIAILALYAAVRVPLLPVPLERDEGAFGLVGQAILRGAVPYRDILDHKPPAVYYAYAGALLVVPPTAAGVHGFLMVWNLATLLCLASLAGELAGPLAARWTAVLFAVVSAAPSIQGFSTTTEMLLLLPLVASWRTAAAATRAAASRRVLLFALSGALGAAACWLKQPAILPLAIVPLFVLGENGGARAARSAADLAAWAGGAALLSLAIVACFWSAGALRELWYWTVEHNRLYAEQPVTDWALRLRVRATNVLWDGGVPLAVGLCAAAAALAQRRRRAWIAPVFVALSAAAVAHSGYFYTHYFALLAPALALIGGLGLAWGQELVTRGWGRRAAAPFAVVALAAVAAPPLLARPWYWLGPQPADVALRTFGPQGFESAERLADYLRAQTKPDDTIFIYGSEPQIAFEAERRLATAFATVYPLTRPWPRHREFQERAWAELERAQPAYLVLARVPASLDRSPTSDPFFEQHLTELLRRAYRGDVVLVADPAGGAQLSRTLPAAGSGAVVQFELWRRSDLFDSKEGAG